MKTNHYTQRARYGMLSLIALITILSILSFDSSWLMSFGWTTYSMLLLIILLCINLIYLNHYTHYIYGEDASEEFFNFPLNFITALTTIVFIYQIAYQVQGDAAQSQQNLQTNLSATANTIVVHSWESDPMKYPDINPLYASVFLQHNSDEDATAIQADWERRFPQIPYVSFKGHELEWHYAAKFCQQMVNVIRAFDLSEKFKVNDADDYAMSFDSSYAGWLVAFRMFMQDATIRNVWEHAKYHHANPMITAWVQFFIIGPVDKNRHFIVDHDAEWVSRATLILDKAVQAYEQKQSVKKHKK